MSLSIPQELEGKLILKKKKQKRKDGR